MSSSHGLSGYGAQWVICDIGYPSYSVCTATSNRLGGMRVVEESLVFDTKRLFRAFWSSFESRALRRVCERGGELIERISYELNGGAKHCRERYIRVVAITVITSEGNKEIYV